MIPITKKQVKDAQYVLSQYPFEDPKSKYARLRNLELAKKPNEKVQIQLNDVNWKFALVNEKGGIIEIDGQLQFSPEKKIECEEKKRAILEETIEFEPYLFVETDENKKFAETCIIYDLTFLLAFELSEPTEEVPASPVVPLAAVKDEDLISSQETNPE